MKTLEDHRILIDKHGIPANLAEGTVELLHKVLVENAATKADIEALKGQIDEMPTKDDLRAEIFESKFSQIKWIVMLQYASIAIITWTIVGLSLILR